MACHQNADIRQTLHAKDRAIIAVMARGDHDAVVDAYQKAKDTGNDYPSALLDLYKVIGVQQTPARKPRDNRNLPLNSRAQYKTKRGSALSSSFILKFSYHLSLNTGRQSFATPPPYSDVQIAERQKLANYITQRGVDHFTHQHHLMAI